MINRPRNKTRYIGQALMAGAAVILMTAGSVLAASPYENRQQNVRTTPKELPMATPLYLPQEHTTIRSVETTTVLESQPHYHDRVTIIERPHEPVYGSVLAPDRTPAPARVENPGNIRFMTGGIGQDEQARFAAAQSEYPVRMVFANTNGAYLSNVHVTVADASGQQLLALQTEGPMLLMDLEPGSYTVTASENGNTNSQRLTVSQIPRSYTVHFRTDAPRDYSLQR